MNSVFNSCMKSRTAGNVVCDTCLCVCFACLLYLFACLLLLMVVC